jgi:hypothetical protein
MTAKLKYERGVSVAEEISMTTTMDLSRVYVPETIQVEIPVSALDRLLAGELFDREVLLNVDVAWPPEA